MVVFGPWKNILDKIPVRIIRMFGQLRQQELHVIIDAEIVCFRGFYQAIDYR